MTALAQPRRCVLLAGLLCAAAGAGLLASASTAPAQVARSFSASPAYQFKRGTPVVRLASVVVRNTTRRAYRVNVFPALLGQIIGGAFTVRERPGELPLAEQLLKVTPRSFVLPAGRAQRVKVQWIAVPRRSSSLAGTVVVEGEPGRVKAGVGTRARILTLDFLRENAHPVAPARFSDLRGEQTGPRKLQIVSRIENLGRNFATPRSAKVTVFDAGRRHKVFQAPWGGGLLDMVIGGYEREFPVKVTKVLPKGHYHMRSEMDFAGHHYVTDRPLVLNGPNALPTIDGRFLSLTGRGGPGEPAHLILVVQNTGNVPLSPTVKLALVRLRSKTSPRTTLVRRVLQVGSIAPHAQKTIETDLAQLSAGRHEAFATLLVGKRELDRATAPFIAVPKRTFGQTFRDFLRKHAVVLILLGVLLLAALLAWLLRDRMRSWRERWKQAAALRDGTTPVAAAPPPGLGRVDVNRAGAEELQTLPGVGPQAARRIIAHRDEFGPFASIDDLSRVEGFDAERIAGLRERASV